MEWYWYVGIALCVISFLAGLGEEMQKKEKLKIQAEQHAELLAVLKEQGRTSDAGR
jgi:hypothetical protein